MLSLWSWYTCVIFVANLEIGFLETVRICPPQKNILPCRCLVRGPEVQIWCSHSNLPKVLEGLQAVGQYIKEPVDELILENNHLPSLPGKTFVPLQVLRLMLRFNGLERVSSGWLTGLESSLIELFIVEPELRSLPEDSLDRMTTLEAITIQSNLMKRLLKFSGLPKLRYLQVESLSLVELSPRHFRVLPKLEKLHIVGSPRLTRLEGGFLQDLPSLTLVNISFCGISWMHPRAITHLPVLNELWLIGNKLTDAAIVGRSIRDLPALEILRLDYNYMDKLGEAAFVDLPSLKKLYMSNNKITELHHGAFHRIPKLRMLDLNKNLVRSVHPESFLQHSGSGLEELWLVENDINHIAELRSLLDALPRLIFLDMSYNNLETIPFGALRGHPTLERLHLDHNRIKIIEREAFMAMPALRELRLKNNSLSDVLEGPLWNLPALKGLDLSKNYFRRLEPRLLANLPSLRKIDLSENELTIIDPESFLGSPSLEYINVSYNALTSLHPATFRHLLGLFELDVNNNQIIEFVPGLPRGIEYLHLAHNQVNNLPILPSPDFDLPALRMLDLTGNEISRISPGTMKSLPQLRKLYIGKNAFKQLEDGSLDGLSRLEILDLHNNRMINISPNVLKETVQLRELKLRQNQLNNLIPQVLQATSHLKKLDISRNQLNEISPDILKKTRDIQILDASHNSLVHLPSSLHGLKHIRVLELTDNHLNTINPELLNNLISLSELRLSQNKLKMLRRGAFDNLAHLKLLFLDNNELEMIEPGAIKSLPSLKAIKLNKNKIGEISDHVFNNLPSLQVMELQDNNLKLIANNGFFEIPHLLMLNLSNNEFTGLDQTGLQNLRSLEMLDLSNNRISRVTAGSLEKMEWLVELRMDNNQICAVQGAPFNEMPRLRVLSMKNNKLITFPEQSILKLRGNLAVLDIDGNPLTCTCNILWFRAWLQESSVEGPHCIDGTLLREMRLSRQDCNREDRQIEPIIPGCEAELLSASGIHGTSQIFSPWIKGNMSKNSEINKLSPSPEESDYFYDEYIDYPYNDTLDFRANNYTHKTNGQSPHYIPGDTPTIYAASAKNRTNPQKHNNIPKGVSSSPSSSGFTFFGLPLPNLNLNLNNFWNRNNGRVNKETKFPPQQTAERKSAIVNNPSASVIHAVHTKRFPPTMPEIEMGGFVPLLPGSGGFKPIPDPIKHQISVGTVEIEKINVTEGTWPIVSSTEISLSRSPVPIRNTPKQNVTIAVLKDTSNVTTLIHNKTHLQTNSKIEPSIDIDQSAVAESKRETANVTAKQTLTTTSKPDLITFIPDLEQTTSSVHFEDIFKEFVDNVSIPANITSTEANTISTTQTSTTTTTPIPQTTSTPLSALLIPGGNQPHYKQQGRPIITRVHSPHVSGSAPLLSDLEISSDEPIPLNHIKEPQSPSIDGGTTQKIGTRKQDMSWYYINYNKTNLEPYIGPGGTTTTINGCRTRIGKNYSIILVSAVFYITALIM